MATWPILRLLSCNHNFREYTRRPLLFQCKQPGLQCELKYGFISARRLTSTQWICSPACTELEQVVLDWMSKLLGLADTFLTRSKVGGGIILVRHFRRGSDRDVSDRAASGFGVRMCVDCGNGSSGASPSTFGGKHCSYWLQRNPRL